MVRSGLEGVLWEQWTPAVAWPCKGEVGLGELIVLEDARIFPASNFAMSNMLLLIAREVDVRNDRLRRWLADLSERCGWHMTFDVRGLPEEDRAEFWSAAQRAHRKLVDRFGANLGAVENLHSGWALDRLVEAHRKISAGEAPSADDQIWNLPTQKMNLDDLWLTGEDQ